MKKHKIFERSENCILPKTNRLNDYHLADSRKIISFSLIVNKLYQSYLDTQKILEKLNQKLQKENTTSTFTLTSTSNVNDVSLKETLDCLLNILKKFQHLCEYIFKEIPGLNELPIDYQAVIIKRNIIDLYMIMNVNYYENGELKIYLDNGQHLTRILLEKLRGTFKTKLFYECMDFFHNLNVSEREKAVLIAFLFTLPGKFAILDLF